VLARLALLAAEAPSLPNTIGRRWDDGMLRPSADHAFPCSAAAQLRRPLSDRNRRSL